MASMLDVKNYFGYGKGEMGKFREDWAALTDQDKNQLKGGIADRTFTY